jgi:hypothetical protein
MDEGYLRRNPTRLMERPTVVAMAPTELSEKQHFVFKHLIEQHATPRFAAIFALGYFDCGQFQQDIQEGGHLFTRLKVGSVKLFDERGEPLDVLTWVQAHASREPAQAWVQVSATHRVRARLIAIPVSEEMAIKRRADLRRRAQKHSRPVNEHLLELAHWTLVSTTIPQGELSIREALILLRLHWQIELLFKLFKKEG